MVIYAFRSPYLRKEIITPSSRPTGCIPGERFLERVDNSTGREFLLALKTTDGISSIPGALLGLRCRVAVINSFSSVGLLINVSRIGLEGICQVSSADFLTVFILRCIWTSGSCAIEKQHVSILFALVVVV